VKENTHPPPLRERILEAALQQFATRGYDATSVRELVAAVGCTKPALYYHFGSKEELFLELVRSRIDGLHELLRSCMDQTGTVEQRLRAVTVGILDGVRQSPLSMRLLLTAEHRPDEGQPEVDLRSMHEAFLEHVRSLLEAGQAAGTLRRDLPAEALAWSYIGAVHVRALGIALGREVPADASEVIVDIFCRGASAPEAPA